MESSLDRQDDLDVVWKEFVREYCRITQQETPDNGSLERPSVARAGSLIDSMSENGNRSRAIISRLCTCLQRFGDAMAGTASIMFGPTALCWNAVSFVISAIQKYQELFDGFVTLLERSNAFFDRLALFLEEKQGGNFLPLALRSSAYQVLGYFLKVLAVVYKVSFSKKEKMKRFAGVVLFADDGGVQANLDHVERLVQDLLHVEVDEILRDVKGLARYLKHSETERQKNAAEILEHLQDSTASLQRVESTLSRVDNTVRRIRSQQYLESSQKEHQSHLKTIQEALLLDPTEVARQQQQQRKLRSSRLEGTGEWLLQNLVFQRWCQVDEPELDLMTLIGEEGYGKSHICSHVIDHLSTQDTREAGNSVVAYFYFNREGNRTKLQECLASIAHQIASADENYAKAAATACRNRSGLASAEALWSALVANPLRDMAGLYFLIICSHGLERDEVAFLKNLTSRALSPSPDNNVRLFLSTDDAEIGRTRGTPVVLSSSTGHARQSLEVTPFQAKPDKGGVYMVNEMDMQIFLATGLEGFCQDPDFRAIALDSGIDIVSVLVEGACGDYRVLATKVEEIGDCDTDLAIKEALSRAGEGRSQTLQRILTKLNGTLIPDDISLLNEMLSWVLYLPSGDCDFQLLQAALFHAHSTRYHVRAKIAAKFRDLLRPDDAGRIHCVYTAEDLEKAMSDVSRHLETSGTLSNPRVTLQEVHTIESLLRAHCDAELYKRFQFAEFLRTKQNLCANIVRIDTRAVGHAHIVLQCLDSLCTRGQDQDPSALREYAAENFAELLLDFDVENAPQALLLAVGDKMAAVFGDPSTIDSWSQGRWLPMPARMLLLDRNGGKVLRLLEHPKAIEGYSGDVAHHKCLKSSVSDTGRPCRLLTHAALRMASRFMYGDTDDESDFEKGAVIISNIWMPVQNENNRRRLYASQLDYAEIDRVLQWLRDQDPCRLPETSFWEQRRIRVLRRLRFEKEALRTVGQECSHPKTIEDVRLYINISACHLSSGERAGALEALSTAKQAATELRKKEMQDHRGASKSPGLDEQETFETPQLHWDAVDREILLQEGRCQYEIKDFEAAAKNLSEVVRAELASPQSRRAVVDQWRSCKPTLCSQALQVLVGIWLETSQWEAITTELLVWLDISVLGTAQIIAFHDYCERARFKPTIIEAAWYTGSWKQIHALFRASIEELSDLLDDADAECIRDLRSSDAKLLLHCSDNSSDHESAVMNLESNMQAAMLRHGMPGSLDEEELALFLVEKAREERSNDLHAASAGRYTRRLQKLADRERTLLGHTFTRVLARLRIYEGKVEEARSCLLDVMQLALRAWSGENEFGCLRDHLARILRTVDDRPNALACQAQSWPFNPPKRLQRAVSLRMECNAHHGSVKAEDIYWCQDCYDTRLCPECHQRCMDGKLCPMICRKWHGHIHITPEDVAQQAAAGPGMISVNGEVIPLKQWLDQLRVDWKLDPESIRQREEQKEREAEASQFIGNWWKKQKAAT